MNKTKSFIEKTINEINGLSRIIKESYDFTDYDSDDELVDGDDANNSDDNAGFAGLQSSAEEKISQIRSVALEGIQAFAENVDSEEYEFFKKIWLMCDKACSDKENNQKEYE